MGSVIGNPKNRVSADISTMSRLNVGQDKTIAAI